VFRFLRFLRVQSQLFLVLQKEIVLDFCVLVLFVVFVLVGLAMFFVLFVGSAIFFVLFGLATYFVILILVLQALSYFYLSYLFLSRFCDCGEDLA
jgi:hypothetical protein